MRHICLTIMVSMVFGSLAQSADLALLTSLNLKRFQHEHSQPFSFALDGQPLTMQLQLHTLHPQTEIAVSGTRGCTVLQSACGALTGCTLSNSTVQSRQTLKISWTSTSVSCNEPVTLSGVLGVDRSFEGALYFYTSNLSETSATLPDRSAFLPPATIFLAGIGATVRSVPLLRFSAPAGSGFARLGGSVRNSGCDVHDAKSYDVIRNAIGVGATMSCEVSVVGGGVVACQSIIDFHRACDNRIDCLGFTTVRRGDVEEPRALHQAGGYVTATPSALAAAFADGSSLASALFYQKQQPAARTCTFRVESRGAVSLFLSQSGLDSSFAQVYLTRPGERRMRLQQCGGASSFDATDATGSRVFSSSSGACDQYLLCYETAEVEAGSVVEVEAAQSLEAKACASALSVFATWNENATTDAGVQRTAVYRASTATPPAFQNRTGQLRRPLALPATAAPSVRISLIVWDAWDFGVGVRQNLYECGNGRPCVAPAVTFGLVAASGDVPRMACGGNLPFSGRPGLSAQCDTEFDCGADDRIVLSSGSTSRGFTGFVYIDVDTAFLSTDTSTFDLPTSCTAFDGAIYLARDTVFSPSLQVNYSIGTTRFQIRRGEVPLFPLVNGPATSPALVTLPEDFVNALPSRFSIEALQGLFVLLFANGLPDNHTVFDAAPLFKFGRQGNRREAYHVKWPFVGFSSAVVAQHQRMHSNVTLACLIDSVTAAEQSCLVPAPSSANYLKVTVAQTDFAANVLRVEFLDMNGAPIEAMTKRCGAQFGFNGAPGKKGLCDEMFTCIDSLYPAGVVVAAVRLVVPNTLVSPGCQTALAAFVEFAQRPTTSPAVCAGGEYFCQSDHQCISRSQLCDGIRGDCSDRADEALCDDFRLVEQGFRFVSLVPATRTTESNTTEECRRDTVAVGGTAFVLTPGVVGRCSVYVAQVIDPIMRQPSRSLTVQPGSAVYLKLPTPQLYRRCSKFLHCSGNGELRNAASLQDGDACVCLCDSNRAGRDCGTLRRMGRASEFYAIMERPTGVFSRSSYRDALTGGDGSISIEADALLPYNASHAALPFVATSFDESNLILYQNALLSPAVLQRVNSRLSQLRRPRVSLIYGTDGVHSPTELAICSPGATSGELFRCPMTTTSVESLLVDTVGLAVFTLEVSVTARNRQGVAATSYRCGGANVVEMRENPQDVCHIATCVLRIDAVVSAIRVLPANASLGPAPPATSCTTPKVSVRRTVMIGLPDILPRPGAPAAVINELQTTAYFFGAVGGITFGAIVIFTAACIGVSLVRRSQRAGLTIATREVMRMLPKWMHDTLAQERIAVRGDCDTESVNIVCGILAGFTLATMGLMWILFYTSQSRTSNYMVVLQFYQTSVCNSNSSVGTLPYQAGVLAATDECATLQFTGQSSGAIVGRAKCVGNEFGEIAPELALTTVETACRASSRIRVAAGACYDLSTFGAARRNNIWVTAACVEEGAAKAFHTRLEQLSASAPHATPASVVLPPPALAPRAVRGSRTRYTWPFATLGEVADSTSHDSLTVAALASRLQYVGDFDPYRLLIQPPQSFDLVADASEIEGKFQPTLTNLSLRNITRWTPNTVDYPVGFVFNGFNSTNEVTGSAALGASHRYLHIRSSPFDLGSHFNELTVTRDTSFTMSAWVRADADTSGFVFAVTDFVERLTEAPILERMRDLVVDGPQTSRPWFDVDYNVYGSLYVQGSTKTMSFAMASSDSVDIVQWDLSKMGQEHFFNGLWHRVWVNLRNDNGRPAAVLGIDGQTKLTNSEYRRCLQRRPRKIVPQRAALNVSGETTSHTLLDDGVMYVGYMNGAVQGVQFEPRELGIAAHIRSGTREIKVKRAQRSNSLLCVAYGLWICAGFAVCAMVYQLYHLHLVTKRDAADRLARLEHNYNELLQTLYGTKYAPLPYAALRTGLGLDDTTLAEILEEIYEAPVNRTGTETFKLVRAAYVTFLAKLPQEMRDTKVEELLPEEPGSVPMPTPLAWATLLQYSGVTPLPSLHGRGAAEDADLAANDGDETAVAEAASANTIVLSILATIQAMSVYTATWSAPNLYVALVVPVFDILSLDFLTLVFESPLTAAIVQLGIASVVMIGLAFVFMKDNIRFYSNVLRYQQKRDRVQGVSGTLSERALNTLLAKIDPEFMLETPYPETYGVELLSAVTSTELQRFEASGEEDVDVFEGDTALHVERRGNSLMFTSTSPVVRQAFSTKAGPTQVQRVCRQLPESEVPVERLRARCAEHDRLLMPLDQSEVFPYSNRRECCAVEDGKRCDCGVGPMFVCTHVDDDGRENCSYATCDNHMRVGVARKLAFKALMKLRRLFGRGLGFALFFIIITAATAFYTPVLKTCVMILACHPLYQCDFPKCWNPIEQQFASAVYLSALVIIVYGFGFPLFFYALLAKRQTVLSDIFLSAIYAGRFTKKPERHDTPQNRVARIDRSVAVALAYRYIQKPDVEGDAPGVLSTAKLLLARSQQNTRTDERVVAREQARQRVYLTAMEASVEEQVGSPAVVADSETPNADGDETPSQLATGELYQYFRTAVLAAKPQSERSIDAAFVESSGLVAQAEWERFLNTDPSALGPVYEVVRFEALSMVPVLFASKFFLLIPPLLLEPDSLQQLAAIAAAEVLYAVMMALYDPFTSVWMTLVILAGNAHQFIVVGLHAYNTGMSHKLDLNDAVGLAMVATTTTYGCLVFVFIAVMFAGGFVLAYFVNRRVKAFFARSGLSRPRGVPHYRAPFTDAVERTPGPDPQDVERPGVSVDDTADPDAVTDWELLAELKKWRATKANARRRTT